MSTSNLSKAALLTLLIVAAAVISWEIHLRNTGMPISYDNLEPLWADKRAMVYEPADKATVFIGSSRIKFDLDVPTWESITGTHAIQLACEGSNPNPLLQDLANDEKFKGNLVIDVTEGLFFAPPDGPNAERPKKNIKYYHDMTPAQKAGFVLNHVLESQFVFLDKDDFSLPATLDKLQIPSRKGILMLPYFPVDFRRVHFSRQSFMTEKMIADTNIQKRVRDMWTLYAKMGRRGPPPAGDTLLQRIQTAKAAIDKIKARGGQVILVRTPSSGPVLMRENLGLPRKKYWDKLVEITDCQGIHFADYPATDHFSCPEWSHLSPADAIVYTKELARILKEEKAWPVKSSDK